MYLGGNRRWVPLIDRDSCCIMKSNKTEKNCLSVLLGLLVIAVKGANGYGRYEIKGEHMAMQICMSLFQLVIGTGRACFLLPPFPLKKDARGTVQPRVSLILTGNCNSHCFCQEPIKWSLRSLH